MKTISLISGCYNEEENLEELIRRVFAVVDQHPEYRWEYLIIDNCSTDRSREIIRAHTARDSRIKAIFNVRNFGHVRSPYHGLMQCRGDAVIYLASDLQDPPEMIPVFLKEWEKGAKVVAAIKQSSKESAAFFLVRKAFYQVISRLAEVDLLRDFTGFGLYAQEVLEHCRKMDDPYPYFRGMISELGYPVTRIPFEQPRRKRGFSKNNLYTLFDLAMLAFTNHTKVPLRLATLCGFSMSVGSFIVALIYLTLKLIFWNEFSIGTAPVVVGLFFIGSIQLFFIGVIGEYVGAIQTKLTKRPLVVEQERINL